MRFYGIPSEDRVLEIIEGIKDGVWGIKGKVCVILKGVRV